MAHNTQGRLLFYEREQEFAIFDSLSPTLREEIRNASGNVACLAVLNLIRKEWPEDKIVTAIRKFR